MRPFLHQGVCLLILIGHFVFAFATAQQSTPLLPSKIVEVCVYPDAARVTRQMAIPSQDSGFSVIAYKVTGDIIPGTVRVYGGELNGVAYCKHRIADSVVEIGFTPKPIRDHFIELHYMVYSAGWKQVYEMQPSAPDSIRVLYKAEIFQHTGEDWDNVKLTLSSWNPFDQMPVDSSLNPVFLREDDEKDKPIISTVRAAVIHGRVVDDNFEPIPGTYVILHQKPARGTITDMDGRFSLDVPDSALLYIEHFGYNSLLVAPVNDSTNSIQMEELYDLLGEIDVVGCGSGFPSWPHLEVRALSRKNVTAVNLARKPFSVNHVLNEQYIHSSPDITILPCYSKNIPVIYEYRCNPQQSSDAYRVVKITDRKQQMLLSGKAAIYQDEIFKGETMLHDDYTEDTLILYLYKEPDIAVQRELYRYYDSRNYNRMKIVKLRHWVTAVKNYHSEALTIRFEDPILFSSTPDVKVRFKDISRYRREGGAIIRYIKLQPQQRMDVPLKYVVKYPYYMDIDIQ